MTTEILKCTNLNKKFGQKHILKNVNLSICEGDIIAFIGPNGAGKTTTIKVMLGLQSITSGHVTINGFDIQKDFVKAINKVGAIIESPDSYMYLTGYQNLKLEANLYPNITKARINEVIKIAGLEKCIKEKVSKYSLGMKQRLGIAIALLHDLNLLILDEPNNGLDPQGIKELRQLLINLSQKEKIGILISSHNLAELENVCNKVCIIKHGEIVETTTVDKLKNHDDIYIIELSKINKLDKIIPYEYDVISETTIKVFVSKNNINKVVKALVKADIEIYSLNSEQISLEDAYFDKTGGNIID